MRLAYILRLFCKMASAMHARFKKRKLIDLCKTRWVERHEAFESFSLLFKALVHAFEEVVDSQSHWSSENVATANRFMLPITQFEFLVGSCKNALPTLKAWA